MIICLACMAHRHITLRPCLVGVLPPVDKPADLDATDTAAQPVTASAPCHVYRELWATEKPPGSDSASKPVPEVQGPVSAQPINVVLSS